MGPRFHPLQASSLCLSLARSSSTWASWHFRPTSGSLDGTLLSLEEVTLQYEPAFLGPSSLRGLIPQDTSKQIPEEARVGSPQVQGCKLAFYARLESLNSTISRSLQPRLPLTFASPTSSSLLASTRSSRAPLLFGPSITWVRKLSTTCSRNLLDCLRPAVLSLQLISGRLKSPVRTRACEREAAPICL